MKKNLNKSKREWNTPAYKSLKFSQTFGGGQKGANENSWSTTLGGTRTHGTVGS